MNLDPRIGVLSSGKHYAYIGGDYTREPIVGSRSEVESALGLSPTVVDGLGTERRRQKVHPVEGPSPARWSVKITYKYPAYDEVDGVWLHGVPGQSKAEAIRNARRRGEDEGHLIGRGMYWLKAFRS